MINLNRFPQARLSAAAVAAVLSAFGGHVAAAPLTIGNITLDATYALGGGATQNGMAEPGSTYSTASGADFYLYKAADGNNVFFHTYGFSGPTVYFGARASGAGYFSAATRTSFSGIFQATAANPAFNFYVDIGEVGLTGTGTGSADLQLQVRLNGNVITSNRTTITQNSSGTTCTDTGSGVLDSYMGCSSGSSSAETGVGGLFAAALTGVNVGDSFTLDYDIIATVSGNLSSGTAEQIICDDYGGYGGYGGDGGYGGNCHVVEVPVPGTAIARSGDPFDFGSPVADPGRGGLLEVTNAVQTQGQVPEPGSLALVAAAGLAGVASMRRRRRDNDA